MHETSLILIAAIPLDGVTPPWIVSSFIGLLIGIGTIWATSRGMKSKADEKSVDERLATQAAHIADCEKHRQYLELRVNELNTVVLKMNGDLVGELVRALSDSRKK